MVKFKASEEMYSVTVLLQDGRSSREAVLDPNIAKGYFAGVPSAAYLKLDKDWKQQLKRAATARLKDADGMFRIHIPPHSVSSSQASGRVTSQLRRCLLSAQGVGGEESSSSAVVQAITTDIPPADVRAFLWHVKRAADDE